MNNPIRDAESHSEFGERARRVVEQLETFLERAHRRDGRVISYRPITEIDRTLDWRRWVESGGMTTTDLEQFVGRYLDLSTKLHHPHFLAHQVAVPHTTAPLAELINGTLNNGMAIYEMGPAHNALERGMLEWMLGHVGWQNGSGVLTHGGSVANLTALLGARAKARPEAWEKGVQGDLAILAPASAHYSVARAASILGLGSESVIPVEVDHLGVLQPEGLPAALDVARQRGLDVMAVVASACQTGTGLHDPLDRIADFCEENDLWLHVDSAHGASALISARLRPRLAGIERADSLVWDAHKMLATSVLCAGALFRQPEHSRRAFQQQAEYFLDTGDPEFENLYDRAIECTKTGLGLKLFVVLAHLGTDGLATQLEGLYERTHDFWKILQNQEQFSAPYEPESNILCFGLPGTDIEEIRRRVMTEGRHYVSSTVVDGERQFRITVMNPRTTDEDFRDLLEHIRKHAQ